MSQISDRAPQAGFLAAVERAEWIPRDFFAEAKAGDIFEREAPLELDLGCGDGAFLLAMARRHPGRNFLGTERLVGRITSLCKKIARGGLTNARVLRLETHYTVRHVLPAECASTAHILFPDPWPKRHHHSRRLIQEPFLADLRRVLAPGAELRIKTDDLPYFQWIEKALANAAGYERLDWVPEADEPKTDFEQLFTARGLPVYRARLRKI